MPTIAQSLDLALRHHQAGELGKAEEIYCQVLSEFPQQVDALHLLGLICHRTGASACFEQVRR